MDVIGMSEKASEHELAARYVPESIFINVPSCVVVESIRLIRKIIEECNSIGAEKETSFILIVDIIKRMWDDM